MRHLGAEQCPGPPILIWPGCDLNNCTATSRACLPGRPRGQVRPIALLYQPPDIGLAQAIEPPADIALLRLHELADGGLPLPFLLELGDDPEEVLGLAGCLLRGRLFRVR